MTFASRAESRKFDTRIRNLYNHVLRDASMIDRALSANALHRLWTSADRCLPGYSPKSAAVESYVPTLVFLVVVGVRRLEPESSGGREQNERLENVSVLWRVLFNLLECLASLLLRRFLCCTARRSLLNSIAISIAVAQQFEEKVFR